MVGWLVGWLEHLLVKQTAFAQAALIVDHFSGQVTISFRIQIHGARMI